jgi:SAM-dependent methyltransferase
LSNKRSLGVTIFGVIFIVSSLWAMVTLLDFNHYAYFFKYLPEKIIWLRYFGSWVLRILILISGIGILCLSDNFRKLAICLFIFTIVTVYWKHPLAGFQNHTAYLDNLFKSHGLYSSFSSIANISAICARIIDVLFAIIPIYYFTRKDVKEQFRVAMIPVENYGLFENFLTEKRARMADKLIPHNLRNGAILDIGCGATPIFLLNTTFKYKYGIEITVESCLARENIILKKLDLEKDDLLPFESDFFDVVTMLAVFEHINPDKLAGVLKEIKRVLRPGARFIVTTPNPWAGKLLWLMAKLGLINSGKMKEHKGAYGKADIVRYFERAGFDIEKTRFGYFELFMNSWVYVDK